MLEGYSVLSIFWRVHEKCQAGTMVTGVIYRYPGILAKTVTTLDVLSKGRAYLGIGAAWNEREALRLGVPFPPVANASSGWKRRCKSFLQMWSGKARAHQGKHYSLQRR